MGHQLNKIKGLKVESYKCINIGINFHFIIYTVGSGNIIFTVKNPDEKNAILKELDSRCLS